MWIMREEVAVSSRKALGFIEHKPRRLLFSIMWINHFAADPERVVGAVEQWLRMVGADSKEVTYKDYRVWTLGLQVRT